MSRDVSFSTPRRAFRCAALVVAVLAQAAAGAAWLGCSGTTGREGSLEPLKGDDGDDGGSPEVDASVLDAEERGFDVQIPYADRVLPDVRLVEAAAPVDWPTCAMDFAGLGPDGGPTDDPSFAAPPTLPAEYDTTGARIVAQSGGACATHVWLGEKAWDDCVREYIDESNSPMPPCSGLADAGNAARGAGTGTPLVDLCRTLATCMSRTGCGLADPAECLCGKGHAPLDDCKKGGPIGACASEELAALQISGNDPGAIDQALTNFVDTKSVNYSTAGALNYLYVVGFSNGCFPADAGH